MLTGFENFVFTDGTVDNYDGNWLVDDLFYYSRNHDVWNAHVDADAHYHGSAGTKAAIRARSSRPSIYLSANPDVKAGGVDPLVHFARSSAGRKGAFLRSTFDPRAISGDTIPTWPPRRSIRSRTSCSSAPAKAASRSRRRELLAAQRLRLRLLSAAQSRRRGRAASIRSSTSDASAGRKGRNPNALLRHRRLSVRPTPTSRRPASTRSITTSCSAGTRAAIRRLLSTPTSYLAAYPDVAAADVNPLRHFLQFGVYEGRSPFDDGTWH